MHRTYRTGYAGLFRCFSITFTAHWAHNVRMTVFSKLLFVPLALASMLVGAEQSARASLVPIAPGAPDSVEDHRKMLLLIGGGAGTGAAIAFFAGHGNGAGAQEPGSSTFASQPATSAAPNLIPKPPVPGASFITGPSDPGIDAIEPPPVISRSLPPSQVMTPEPSYVGLPMLLLAAGMFAGRRYRRSSSESESER